MFLPSPPAATSPAERIWFVPFPQGTAVTRTGPAPVDTRATFLAELWFVVHLLHRLMRSACNSRASVQCLLRSRAGSMDLETPSTRKRRASGTPATDSLRSTSWSAGRLRVDTLRVGRCEGTFAGPIQSTIDELKEQHKSLRLDLYQLECLIDRLLHSIGHYSLQRLRQVADDIRVYREWNLLPVDEEGESMLE